jgi:hydrogenase expression/formation protein HypD
VKSRGRRGRKGWKGRNDVTGNLEFRDPERAKALVERLARTTADVGRTVSIMHVCGSHEQAIAKFGLRASLPDDLNVIMGPGCPVLHHRPARDR